MIKRIKAIWNKVIEYIKYLWRNPKTTFPAFLIAEAVFWLPVWLSAIFALTISAWWWTVVGVVITFWAGPFTPALPLQIGLIAVVERIIVKIKNKKVNDDEDEA
jgi:hypothetical protein